MVLPLAVAEPRADQRRDAVKTPADAIDSIQAQIKDAIERQEAIGLDVLVHGEAERNDMVEYFGEQLDGYAFSQHGWVQSYGSRCVKPPVIYGDGEQSRDFTYVENGQLVVEDVKSPMTRKLAMYRLKAKWMRIEHGITIRET